MARWCYGHGEHPERYDGELVTREEAITEGTREYEGETFCVGTVIEVSDDAFWDRAAGALMACFESADEELSDSNLIDGEDGWLRNHEDDAGLQMEFAQLLRRRLERPQWWGVKKDSVICPNGEPVQ